MFKKMLLGMLVFFSSVTAYAYVVGANFTVENKTDIPLFMLVEQPNGQTNNSVYIPPHESTQLYMVNGDYSGLLYQTATALLKMTGVNDNKNYLQGRIAYYVGGTAWRKYSFLDAVSAAQGLEVNKIYSCGSGDINTVFENKLVISGTPTDELQFEKYPDTVTCQGLKISTMEDSGKKYYPVCFNGDKEIYQQMSIVTHCQGDHCHKHYKYKKLSDRKFTRVEINKTGEIDDETLHAALDEKCGKVFCQSW